MHRGSINVNTFKSSFFYFAHSARTNIKLLFSALCYLCLGLRLTHQEIEKITSFNVVSLNYHYYFKVFFRACVCFSYVQLSSSVKFLFAFFLHVFLFFFCFEKSLHCRQPSLLLDFGQGDIPLSNFASAYANKQSSAAPHFRPMSRIFQPPLKRPKTS